MPFTSRRSIPTRPATPVSRIFEGLFGMVFLGMGLLLVGFLGSTLVENLRLRLQPAISFRVVETEIVTADMGRSGFDLVIRFQEPGRGETGRAELHAADYRDLVVAQRELAPGAPVIGRRLPADHPARLDRVEPGFATLLALPLLALPAAFALVGGWTVWGAATGRNPAAAAKPATHPFVLLGVGTLFTTLGGVAVAFLVVIPVVRHIGSRDWVSTPAVIEMSRSVTTRSGKGGRSRHPEVLYRYDFAGAARRSSRIRFSEEWSRSGTSMFLQRHPVGARTSCLVNPTDPDQAVLERGLSWAQVIGLVFVLFPVAGGYLLRGGWRALGQRGRTSPGRGQAGPFGVQRL